MSMKKEEREGCCQKVVVKKCHHSQNGGAIYSLGVVGALFYFLQDATTLVIALVGIGKSVFWPAILMFKLLTYLNL